MAESKKIRMTGKNVRKNKYDRERPKKKKDDRKEFQKKKICPRKTKTKNRMTGKDVRNRIVNRCVGKSVATCVKQQT